MEMRFLTASWTWKASPKCEKPSVLSDILDWLEQNEKDWICWNWLKLEWTETATSHAFCRHLDRLWNFVPGDNFLDFLLSTVFWVPTMSYKGAPGGGQKVQKVIRVTTTWGTQNSPSFPGLFPDFSQFSLTILTINLLFTQVQHNLWVDPIWIKLLSLSKE